MEPLDSDLEYNLDRSRADLRSRFNWLQFLPVLGIIWIVFLAAAAIFQWPITAVINPVMSLMIVIFFVFVGLFFWAMAPRSNRE